MAVKEWKERCLVKKSAGSFTVELALLFPLITALLIAILIVGFYLHDRAILQGAACESAAMGSNLANAADQTAVLSHTAAGLMRRRGMWIRGASGSIDASEDQCSASYSGKFHFPGLIASFLLKGDEKLHRSWSRSIYHPAKIIRKIRGAKYVIDTIWQ